MGHKCAKQVEHRSVDCKDAFMRWGFKCTHKHDGDASVDGKIMAGSNTWRVNPDGNDLKLEAYASNARIEAAKIQYDTDLSAATLHAENCN